MALACSWEGYADTDVDLSEFFAGDHTVAVRFMLQYPNAYTGPMLSVMGTGTYLIGQGDFSAAPGGQAKLVVQVGSGQITHATSLAAGTWRHLAVVRSGNTFTLYLDGQKAGSTLTFSGAVPAGKLRLGKDTFDPALDGGGKQLYGFLDDLAIFKKALSASQIQSLASAAHLSGQENDLHAGFVFGYTPPGGLPAKLKRPLSLSVGASLQTVSANRDNAADSAKLPLGSTAFMHLPCAPGTTLSVIQGFGIPNGSHKGYAAFCWDLMLAGKPQSESNGKPFHAAAPGKVDFVKEDAASGGATNFLTVQHAPHELCDYLHLAKDSATVAVGDQVQFDQHLANIGDTGASQGAYHLHLAVTNLGEGKKQNGAFVTIPVPFCNYESSDDQGKTWKHRIRGIPTSGQWLRRSTIISSVRYTAVWTPSTEGEIQVYGWTYDDYRAKYDELWKQGWRLKLLCPFVVSGQVRYTAVWRPSTEGEIQVYGWTYDDYRAKYDDLWKQGWRLKFICPYAVGSEVRYTAAWRPSTEGEVQVYGWSYKDYRAKYDELWKQGWRLKLIAPYVVDKAVRYTAAWKPGNDGELQVYGWTYEDYRAKYDGLWNRRWRLKLLSPYVQ